MRTYEVTVKVPAYYGREGAGRYWTGKIQAGSRGYVAAKAIKVFLGLNEAKDLIGRQIEVKIVRVA